MSESKLRGLRFDRDIDDSSFVAFFDVVQKSASSDGMVFFFDTGAGNDFSDASMSGEDLMGWLVPGDQADKFESSWLADTITDEMDDEFFAIARWNKSGNKVSVKFETNA